MPQTRVEQVLAMMGLVVIAALIALTIPAWLHYRDEGRASVHSGTVSLAITSTPLAGSTGPTSAATVSPAATGSTSTAPQAQTREQAQAVSLDIDATRGPCWLEVHAGSSTGKLLYTGALEQGKTLSFEKTILWIRFGAPENVASGAQLAPKNVTLEMREAGRAWLAKSGYDRAFGARPMARLIQQKIKEPLVDEILFGRLQGGGAVVVDADNAELRLVY